VSTEAEFRASLECYRGPLDLLLYLIKKDEVDILDIPIGRITEQFLAYIQILSSLDPNACGEFLVVAARLMEIKSRELLPIDLPEEEEEELEDPRLELVLQLLEYKKYKERALLLEHMVGEHRRRHRRPENELDDLPDEPAVPIELGNVSMWDLVTAFQKVQLALNMRQPHRVLFEDRPIEDFVEAIEARLAKLAENGNDDSSLAFESLFDDCRDRYDAIGYFLAVLELAKQGRIFFTQDELFGPIAIRKRLIEPEDNAEEETDTGVPPAEAQPDANSDTESATQPEPQSERLTEDLGVAEHASAEDSDTEGSPDSGDLDADGDSDSEPESDTDPDASSPFGANRITGYLSDSTPPPFDRFPPTTPS
jgi:segregation and condensation protein A